MNRTTVVGRLAKPSDRLRRAEVGRLLHDRYGDGRPLPDTTDTRRDAGVMLEHLAYLPPRYLQIWIADNAPWCTTAMVKLAMRKRVSLKADAVGRRLCLTSADRNRLKIRTIGAIDCTKDERAELRKQKRAAREKVRRAKAGATPRETSIECQKPWRDLGISRRTYYSRKKACADSRPIAFEKAVLYPNMKQCNAH